MAINYHQISLKESFSDCKDMFIDDAPSFFQLLEQHSIAALKSCAEILSNIPTCIDIAVFALTPDLFSPPSAIYILLDKLRHCKQPTFYLKPNFSSDTLNHLTQTNILVFSYY